MVSVPAFELPLWLIWTLISVLGTLFYLVLAGFTAGVFRRWYCDEPEFVLAGVFWPVAWPGLLLWQIPFRIYRRIGGN